MNPEWRQERILKKKERLIFNDEKYGNDGVSTSFLSLMFFLLDLLGPPLGPPELGIDPPLSIEIKTEGLPKRSWVKFSQVRTLAAARIGKTITRLSPEELSRIVDGLSQIIGG